MILDFLKLLEWMHPGLLLILGAWLLPLLRGRVKRLLMLVLPAAALVICVCLSLRPEQELVLGRVDSLSLVFSYIFSIMAFLGMVYALHVNDDVQHVAALTYAGAALGVTFAGDFLSLYVFWELMAISSVLLVWQRREKSAAAAGFRYLMVHIFGGLILLAGIVLHSFENGSLAFDAMKPFAEGAGWGPALILVAFLLNAAVPPLGAWLPDAYPEATVTGAVFMTAFTTKSAVYVLIRGFAGTDLLIWLGAAMAIYGVVYAVLENDARRLLAYHIISQVGYMVCGVGIGTALALNGATAHAFAHILYKALLFMGAGAVIQMTGRRKLSEMGGLYKTMPITLWLYMIGAFAISAVPLFSGFVTKSMVISATGDVEHGAWLVFLLLTLASAGTFLHTGLKLPYYMFFGKDSGVSGKEPPRNMLVAMGLAAAACVLIGILPGLLYRHLPQPGFDNWGGAGEKWFSSAHGERYYFITPNGDFHRWTDASSGAGFVDDSPLMGSLDSSYHADPSKISKAPQLSTELVADLEYASFPPYTLHHVTSTLGMLGFTALGFFLLLKHLDPEPKVSLDTDWFYRRGSAIVVTPTRQQVGTRLLLCMILGIGWVILTAGGLDQLLPGWQRLLKTLGVLSAGIGLVLLGDLVVGLLLAGGRLARFESGLVGEIYEFVMRRLVLNAAGLLREFDTRVVDSIAVGVGRLTQALSQFLRTKVSGNAQHYGLMMAAGVLTLLALALFVL
jgi:multicomponent Na+:H+ antiporter subunit D